jgi:hypothetical protein
VQGQSCDEVCAANCGMTCDATQLAAIDTADKLDTTVAPFISCAKPYLVRCGREGVTSSDDGLCYYHGGGGLRHRRPQLHCVDVRVQADHPRRRLPHLSVHRQRHVHAAAQDPADHCGDDAPHRDDAAGHTTTTVAGQPTTVAPDA